MAETPNVVAVSRRIAATPDRIFAVLADPARHPEFDGSGMVRKALDSRPVRGVGDAFVMAMHNDEMGDYEMTNHVVDFETNRRIAWRPMISGASRPEDVAAIGDSARQLWAFTLVADGPDSTEVTETFDCTASPEWLQKAVRGGQRWSPTMAVSLERLETLTVLEP